MKTLAAAGFEVVPMLNTPSLVTGMALANDYFSLDNSKEAIQHVLASGEPIIPSILRTLEIVNGKGTDYTLDDLWEINAACGEYKAAWHKQWVDHDLDVVLCAGAQTTAVPHDHFGIPHYTAVWNLLEVGSVESLTVDDVVG